MGKILSIMSGRGGVGKTTTTANLGFELAMLGKKTLLVDENLYLPDLHGALGISDEQIEGFVSTKIFNDFDIKDIIKNKVPIQEILINTASSNNLFFLSSYFLLRNNNNIIKHKDLLSLYRILSNSFDYVLIDFPPGIDSNFYHLLPNVHKSLIITTSELASVKDSVAIINKLNSPIPSCKNNSKASFEKHLIINKLPCNSTKQEHTLNPQDIEDILETKVIGIVPYDNKVIISTDKGIPMTAKKNNNVALAYNNIARRILGEGVNFLNLNEQLPKRKSLFSMLLSRSGSY